MMHELSLARSLFDLVLAHQPPGTVVRSVNVLAGVLQGIDPEAMQWAWQAVIGQTSLAGSQLRVETIPWQWRCRECGRQWASDHPPAACDCGATALLPAGGAELILNELEVEPTGEDSAHGIESSIPRDMPDMPARGPGSEPVPTSCPRCPETFP